MQGKLTREFATFAAVVFANVQKYRLTSQRNLCSAREISQTCTRSACAQPNSNVRNERLMLVFLYMQKVSVLITTVQKFLKG